MYSTYSEAHIRPKKDPDLAGQGWGGNRPPFATYLYLGLADLGTGLGLGPVGLATFTSPLWGGGREDDALSREGQVEAFVAASLSFICVCIRIISSRCICIFY